MFRQKVAISGAGTRKYVAACQAIHLIQCLLFQQKHTCYKIIPDQIRLHLADNFTYVNLQGIRDTTEPLRVKGLAQGPTVL